MIKHAYDSDGVIVGQAYDPNGTVAADWLAAGLSVADAAEFVDPEAFTYADGAIAAVAEPTEAEALAAAILAAKGALRDEFNRFVAYLPDGRARYDTSRTLNLLAALAQESPPLAALNYKAWMLAAQGGFFSQKAALGSAADAAALAAVQTGYAWFEARYGGQGDTCPDPGVSTEDLLEPAQ